MKVKQYQNKSSVLKSYTRYVQGGNTTVYKKRLGWWERFTDIEKPHVTDIEVTITSEYLNRPDLIAFDYYGNTNLLWIILQYNDIVDIKEELTTGAIITIPTKDRVLYSISIHQTKFQESKL